MRRGIGAGAALRQQQMASRAQELGARQEAAHAAHVAEQMASFRSHLEEFARKYRGEINRDPAFRRAFVQMCKSIGIDPLASAKGFWAEVLGVGDFYYELAVQVADVCIATRPTNGGIIPMSRLLAHVRRLRGRSGAEVTVDDVKRALRALESLGGGYSLVRMPGGSGGGGGAEAGGGGSARPRDPVDGEEFVLSVPQELSVDQTQVLALITNSGKAYTTPAAVCAELRWDRRRADAALQRLLRSGLAWLDLQGAREGDPPTTGPRYYLPSLMG